MFHKMLVEVIQVNVYKKEGITRELRLIRLIDFDEMNNNDFVVANQFTIVENGHNKRPDIILFINGLPLVVIELKS